ncbi:uncharacterized protein [Miscanthus floridulus]|uniref:uncharacterized protein isoform X1 n=2 Tax=Miscanthus floridulus TaxID=154761 RepID=UPI003458BAC7
MISAISVQTPSLCYMSCSPGTRLRRTSPPSVAPVHHVGHPSGQHIAMNKEVHLQARVHVIVAGTEESNTDEGWNFQENAMKQLQNFLAPLLILGLMLSSMSSSTADQKEVWHCWKQASWCLGTKLCSVQEMNLEKSARTIGKMN